jgi:hypothetical protein
MCAVRLIILLLPVSPVRIVSGIAAGCHGHIPVPLRPVVHSGTGRAMFITVK